MNTQRYYTALQSYNYFIVVRRALDLMIPLAIFLELYSPN